MSNGQTKEETMALRVPKAKLITEMSESMIKQLGAVPEPVEVMWNNPQVESPRVSCSAG
jgi:phenylpyruvate tautomerase PptA (4-oxalocrotonate tautomerase family)